MQSWVISTPSPAIGLARSRQRFWLFCFVFSQYFPNKRHKKTKKWLKCTPKQPKTSSAPGRRNGLRCSANTRPASLATLATKRNDFTSIDLHNIFPQFNMYYVNIFFPIEVADNLIIAYIDGQYLILFFFLDDRLSHLRFSHSI